MIAGRKREENQFELVSKEKNKSEKNKCSFRVPHPKREYERSHSRLIPKILTPQSEKFRRTILFRRDRNNTGSSEHGCCIPKNSSLESNLQSASSTNLRKHKDTMIRHR